MSDYLEYGGLEEDAKELRKKVADFFQTDYQVLYDAIQDAYEQGVNDTREKIAKEIEDLIDPPPIDEIDYIIVDVIKRCAEIASGIK